MDALRVSPNILTELGDALDATAATLRTGIATANADFATLPVPDGLASTEAIRRHLAARLAAAASIQSSLTRTASALRSAAEAYAGADDRAAQRSGGDPS